MPAMAKQKPPRQAEGLNEKEAAGEVAFFIFGNQDQILKVGATAVRQEHSAAQQNQQLHAE